LDSSEEIFVQHLHEHQKLVYKVCHAYASDPEDIRDLFQEIVLQAWSGFKRYRGESSISTWLYRVALNTAIVHKRKQAKHQSVTSTDVFNIDIADKLPAAYAEEYKLLQQMIHALPPLDKALILLYMDDKPHTEIADILGISVSNVGTKLGRIKDKLKQQAKAYL
jgi:RNA polymerase sigma factor (sigma-70 family)